MAESPINILLFEDDESQAILTREALEEQGMKVDVAARGGDGLKIALTKHYNCFSISLVKIFITWKLRYRKKN